MHTAFATSMLGHISDLDTINNRFTFILLGEVSLTVIDTKYDHQSTQSQACGFHEPTSE